MQSRGGQGLALAWSIAGIFELGGIKQQWHLPAMQMPIGNGAWLVKLVQSPGLTVHGQMLSQPASYE